MRKWDPYNDHLDNQPVGVMKEWPDKEDESVNYEDLVNPLLEIFAANYTRSHNDSEYLTDLDGYGRSFSKYRDVVYNGYNIGMSDRAGIPEPAYNLNPSGLRYHEGHDRELYHVLFNIVFCLGMEQGRRDCARSNHRMIEIKAECRARGEKWPPDPLTPEEREEVVRSIAKLLKQKKKSVTKPKKKRKTKGK